MIHRMERCGIIMSKIAVGKRKVSRKTPAKRRQIVGLDALKCFAIILIVIYHCFPGVLPGGFLAVELFFVVSGFLIGRKLLLMQIAEREQYGGWKSFWRFVWGRLKRFWPMLLFCMILTLSLAYFADPDLLTNARSNSLAAATFTTNITSILTGSTYENSLIPNLFNQTWFLALELQLCVICYLVVTWFFRLLPMEPKLARRRYWQLFALCALLCVVSYTLMGVYGGWFGLQTRAYFGPDSHAGAFFAGVALVCLVMALKIHPAKKGRRLLWVLPLVVGLIGVSAMTPFVAYASSDAFMWALPLTALLSLVAVFALLKLQKYNRKKILWWLRVLEYVGSLSFGIYLLHYGLNIILPDLLGFCPPEVVPFVVITLSVILAALLKHVIVPFSVKHKVWFYLLAAASLVLPVLSLIKAPEKSSIEENLAEAAAARKEALGENADTKDEVEIDYSGVSKLAGLMSGDVMKFFDGAGDFAKPYPVVVRAVGSAVNTSGRGYYNTADISRASALSSARVMVLGDSVVMGASGNIYGTVPGVFVDALQSRNMTDAINLLAGYRASNGGNLPYIIVLGLVTNYTPFGIDTLQTIMDTAGPGHQFVFVTGYCGDYSREAQNNVIKAVAASYGNVHVADWVPVVLSNLGGYTYADHTHLTPEGRQAYANLINGVVSGL